MPSRLTPLDLLSDREALSAGGKVANSRRLRSRLGMDVPVNVDELRASTPESAALVGLNPLDLTAGCRVDAADLERCGLMAFPLIVRSSAESEDAGTSSMSGLLDSTAVVDLDGLNAAVQSLYQAASDLAVLPVSALIQPVVSYDVGAVVAISGTSSGPTAARAEFSLHQVPVESTPDGWIEYHARKLGDAGVNWDVVQDSGAITHDIDIDGALRRIYDIVLAGEWAELTARNWLCELEVGITSDMVWVFQIRFDLESAMQLRTEPSIPLPFGSGRNFPAPVSRLTAGLVSSVLSDQFGAPIALDEYGRYFVCNAFSVPPASYVNACVRAVRDNGPLNLRALIVEVPWLNDRWRSIVATRERANQIEDIAERFLYAGEEFRRHLTWYFSNPLFRRAVGTEYLLEGRDEFRVVSELIATAPNRSMMATQVFNVDSLARVLELDPACVSVYLFGDDSIGTARLLERLADRYPDDPTFDLLIRRFFERESLFEADAIESHGRALAELNWGDIEGAMYAALWYQEQDNQFKDALYLMMRETLLAASVASGLPLECMLELWPSELADLLTGTLTSDECRLRASLRSRVLGTGTSFQSESAPSASSPVSVIATVLGEGYDGDLLEVVPVSFLAAILSDTPSDRLKRVYVVPAASPIECLEAPTVGGLWLSHLGELCHAAHILRSRATFPLLIFGQVDAANFCLGTRRVTSGDGRVVFDGMDDGATQPR